MSWKEELKGLDVILNKWGKAFEKWIELHKNADPLSKECLIIEMLMPLYSEFSRITMIAEGYADPKILPYYKDDDFPKQFGGDAYRMTRMEIHMLLLRDPVMKTAHAKLGAVYKKYKEPLMRLMYVAMYQTQKVKDMGRKDPNDVGALIGCIKLVPMIEKLLDLGLDIIETQRVMKRK